MYFSLCLTIKFIVSNFYLIAIKKKTIKFFIEFSYSIRLILFYKLTLLFYNLTLQQLSSTIFKCKFRLQIFTNETLNYN